MHYTFNLNNIYFCQPEYNIGHSDLLTNIYYLTLWYNENGATNQPYDNGPGLVVMEKLLNIGPRYFFQEQSIMTKHLTSKKCKFCAEKPSRGIFIYHRGAPTTITEPIYFEQLWK